MSVPDYKPVFETWKYKDHHGRLLFQCSHCQLVVSDIERTQSHVVCKGLHEITTCLRKGQSSPGGPNALRFFSDFAPAGIIPLITLGEVTWVMRGCYTLRRDTHNPVAYHFEPLTDSPSPNTLDSFHKGVHVVITPHVLSQVAYVCQKTRRGRKGLKGLTINGKGRLVWALNQFGANPVSPSYVDIGVVNVTSNDGESPHPWVTIQSILRCSDGTRLKFLDTVVRHHVENCTRIWAHIYPLLQHVPKLAAMVRHHVHYVAALAETLSMHPLTNKLPVFTC